MTVKIWARCSFPWLRVWATRIPAFASVCAPLIADVHEITRSGSNSSARSASHVPASSSDIRISSASSSVSSGSCGHDGPPPERRRRYRASAPSKCCNVEMIEPYVPSAEAPSCEASSFEQNASSSRVAHELWRRGSVSGEVNGSGRAFLRGAGRLRLLLAGDERGVHALQHHVRVDLAAGDVLAGGQLVHH